MFLYVKKHNVTGLKYLGVTKKDPYKYSGSGIYWNRHLKKHGYNVSTEILLETYDKKELSEIAECYSLLWNIVESEEWANEVLELGQGGYNFKAHQTTLKKIKEKTHHFCNVEKQKERSRKGNVTLTEMWKNGTHPSLLRIKEGIHPTKIKWKCKYCGKEGQGKSNLIRWHSKCGEINGSV